jgi:hypothetical protein
MLVAAEAAKGAREASLVNLRSEFLARRLREMLQEGRIGSRARSVIQAAVM